MIDQISKKIKDSIEYSIDLSELVRLIDSDTIKWLRELYMIVSSTNYMIVRGLNDQSNLIQLKLKVWLNIRFILVK